MISSLQTPDMVAQGDTLQAPQPRSISVLIVDDRKDLADILGLFFESEGHRARVAYNGFEALKQVVVEKPDLILMDLCMPEMNGLEAAARIREIQGDARIVVIALTAFDDDECVRKCQDHGFDRHLTKPANPNRLRTLVSELF